MENNNIGNAERSGKECEVRAYPPHHRLSCGYGGPLE